MAEHYIAVLVTVDSEGQAKEISDILLKRRLVACANVVRDVQSFFWWKGKVEESEELLLIMKSRAELLEDIVKLVKEKHSYEVPEVVALPIVGGNADYLSWIDESVEAGQKGDSS